MKNSKIPLSGQCQCGAIRYKIDGQALTFYACHCLDCQAQSASAFGLSMWVKTEDFKLETGQLKFWSTRADDGSIKRCAFCPDCGTRIYHATGGAAISLKAGSLNDTSQLKPVAHIWTKRAHNWLGLDKLTVLCFKEQPENFDEILNAWENQITD